MGCSCVCSGYPQPGAQWLGVKIHLKIQRCRAMADNRESQILGVAMQNDAPATQVGKLLLQDVDLRFGDRHTQRDTIGIKGFIQYQAAEVMQTYFQQGQLTEHAFTVQLSALDQGHVLGILQTLVGTSAIGARQPASAQLDTAVPANNQDRDLIKILSFDGGQNGPSCGTAGLAVVMAAVLVRQLPGPTVV